MRRLHLYVALIVLFSLVKGLLWLVVVPPFQSPDEPEHWNYVQYISESRKLPLLPKPGERTSSEETAAYLDFFDVNKIAFHQGIHEDFDKDISELLEKDFDREVLTSGQASHPPVFYLIASLAYNAFHKNTFIARFYAVRTASLLLLTGGLIFIFLSLRILFNPEKEGHTPLLLTLAIGLHPMLNLISVSINPDIGLFFFFNVFLFLVLRSLFPKNQPATDKPLTYVLLGLIGGITTLSKISGIVVLPIFLVALMVKNRGKLKPMFIKSIKPAILFGFAYLLTVAPWFYFNIKNYGTVLVDNFYLLGLPFVTQGRVSMSYGNYFDLKQSLISFWGNFGWLDTPLDQGIVNFLNTAFLFGLLAVPLFATRGLRRKKKQISPLFLFSTPIALLLLMAFVNAKFRFNYGATFLQGRYYLPVLAPLFALAIEGWHKLLATKHEVAAKVFLLYFLFLNNLVLFGYLIPRYYV